MKVSEAMTDHPEYLSPDTKITKVAKEMRDRDFGFLPIGENDKLIGVITDRDIIIRCIADGLNPNEVLVGDILTPHVYYCYEDDDLKDACDLMHQYQIRRLIVLNRDKRLKGILSLGDLVTHSHDEHLNSEIIEFVSKKAA